MDRGALVALEHPRGGALPPVGRCGRRDLGQYRVTDPRLRRNTLDGEDLGESLGTRHAHLVVLCIVQDEGPALDAGQEQRRARDAGAQRRGCDDRGATAAARSAAVSCCAASVLPGGDVTAATTRHARSLDGVFTRLIYLLLFMAPQVLIYVYLRERLPDPTRPRQAHRVRVALATLFIVFNLPWLVVGQRVLFGGSMWGVGRIPFTGPWIAWQLLGWVFCALVALYLLGKGGWWLATRLRGAWFVVRGGVEVGAADREKPLTTHHAVVSRRRFLARSVYAYAAAGTALSAYGIWSAYRLPQVTRRTLVFPDLP